MIKVMLADDEQLLREGVRLVLRHADDIEVTAEADDGAEAVRVACTQPVDVALVDIRMPGTDGLTAAEQLAVRAPAVKVVMLTTFGEQEYITRALRAGAAGFLLKDSGPQELIHAVRAAAHGGAILSPRITKDLIATHVMPSDSRAVKAQCLVDRLNERERDVLVMVGVGASNAEAARLLYMGEGTVKTYVSRILAKLGCANRVQAAIIAHDAGLLPAG